MAAVGRVRVTMTTVTSLMTAVATMGRRALPRRPRGGPLALPRRSALALPGALLVAGQAGCARQDAEQQEGDQQAAAATATPVEWRNPNEVRLEPEYASRNIKQVTQEGQAVTQDGLTLTAPEGTTVEKGESSGGQEQTTILFPDLEGDPSPDVHTFYAPDLGRSLLAESQYQEISLLAVQRGTNPYVVRSREQWPGTEEAYYMTWYHVDTQRGWTSQSPGECASLWISDGATGMWAVLAVAGPGQLLSGSSPVMDTLLSARIGE
ncbi:hypothetical protein D5R93_01335 [Actinomyces lilanjuaniae]|uniref:Uncharacterized protein n=2 Tax=Actinomyces lilanjuaniae TaxID=2321394 RepID=A0ABM6Z1Q4_9ACTO|nr:hypothetical protein D5R93_01335 [Actinomyces lilanjuaniae]